MPDQTNGPPQGRLSSVPSGTPPGSRGPRRSTLEQLAEVISGPLFCSVDDGWASLTGTKAALAEAMGVSPAALSSRLAVLRASGLAQERPEGLAIAAQEITSRLACGAPTRPTRRSSEVRRRLSAEGYRPRRDPSGKVVYLRPDGGEASLRDVAAAAGFASRGSAAYHLRRDVDDLPELHAQSLKPEPDSPAPQDHAALMGSLLELVSETVRTVRTFLGNNAAADSAAASVPQLRAAQLEDAAAALQLSAGHTGVSSAQPEGARPQTRRRATANRKARDPKPEAFSEMRMRHVDDHSHPHSRVDSGLPVESRATANRKARDPKPEAGALKPEQPPAADAPLVPRQQLLQLLAPLPAVADRYGMAAVHIDTAAEAAAGLTAQQIETAVTRMCTDADRRSIINIGGLFVKAARQRDPQYFPPLRPTPRPSVQPQPECGPAADDVSAEENSRRVRELRESVAPGPRHG